MQEHAAVDERTAELSSSAGSGGREFEGRRAPRKAAHR